MEYVSCNLCGSTQTKLVFPSTIPDRSQAARHGSVPVHQLGYGRHHAHRPVPQLRLIYFQSTLGRFRIDG